MGNIQKIKDSRFYGCLFSGIKGGKKGKKIAETEQQALQHLHSMDFTAIVSDYGGLKAGHRRKCSREEEQTLSGNIDSEPVGRITENCIIEKTERIESESTRQDPESTDADPQRNIRVLLMTDGYQQIVHREVEGQCSGRS